MFVSHLKICLYDPKDLNVPTIKRLKNDTWSIVSISLFLTHWIFRVNIMLGPQEERLMLSGMHTVEDIFCCCCGQIVGWKYVSSFQPFFSCFSAKIWVIFRGQQHHAKLYSRNWQQNSKRRKFSGNAFFSEHWAVGFILIVSPENFLSWHNIKCLCIFTNDYSFP